MVSAKQYSTRQTTPLLMIFLVLLVMPGIAGAADKAVTTNESSAFVLRDIRVLVASNVPVIEIRADVPCSVRDRDGNVLVQFRTLEWTRLTATENGVRFGEQEYAIPCVDIIPHGGVLWMRAGGNVEHQAARLFSGFLRCCVEDEAKLDGINYVDIESYVAGVISRELYSHFHRETFRAQAVASRTYAAWQMMERNSRTWDVRATQASQVYCGLAAGEAGAKAKEAVEYTRGIVCTWDSPAGERIFCTFFSACCGGASQDVSNVMNCQSIPPLAGGVKCDYCRDAGEEIYSWGPVAIDHATFTERLVRRYPAYASLGLVKAIEVVESTKHGRPVRVKLVGADGEVIVKAEVLRAIVGYSTLKSTHCTILNEEAGFRFENGRGFGHGIGFCQWGAEGQAKAGRKASVILRYYYPGSHLRKAW